ncbi:hypothetical protein JCM10908_004090 [Rhodotorula pacifica]|uniref:riboflavin synthase n=1 Tax=Rhodotorula pacifica TaxID=1495444 RepID=UPI00316E1D6F
MLAHHPVSTDKSISDTCCIVAVFTGLIEILGRIDSIHPTTEFEGYSFVIADAHDILGDCNLGDSIAVNGCCLTVTRFDAKEGWFEVGLANETLTRTNLGKLGVGSKVNLERAMAGHGRFGGHFVQGHVDTTAKIVSKVPDGDSIRMLFSLPLEFFNPMIPKGYVALDGTSLTLTHLSTPRTPTDAHFDPSDPNRGVFGVMLIAHTQSRTVVAAKEVGDTVNVECDIVGKGVESVVRNVLEGGGESGGALEQMIERVVGRVLVEKGLVKE